MKVLLDTHVLLWAIIEPKRLGGESRRVLEDPENEVLFSAASIWEIAIKSALGRADFRVPPSEIVASARKTGFAELPVRSDAMLLVATLPAYHRDPFDRLLVAQALAEPAVLYTADAQLEPYSDLVRRI